MEFKNISDEKSASTIRNVKVVKSMRSLSENLLAGMKEKNLSGLGIYLKVKLRKGGSSDVNVKIPFFLVPKKSSNFLNLNGVNKVNPLAIKLMKKWQGKNAAAFDLDVDYKNPKLAEIATQIAALGATPDPAALAALTDKQTAVNALQDKDTENVIKDLIDDLEDKLSKKLDLSTYPDAASKEAALDEFVDNWKKYLKLKVQLKKLTWSKKRGISKFNNKYVKAGVAILVAGALVFTSVSTRLFGLIPKKDSKPKNKQIQTYNPSEDENVVTINTGFEETKTTSTVNNQANYSLEGAYFNALCEQNYNKFSFVYNDLRKEYNYKDCIKGYTVIENLDSLDVSGISKSELEDYILNARVLLAYLISYNPSYIGFLNLNESTYDCLNGNVETWDDYVSQASESGVPIFDMLVVGQMYQAFGTENISNFSKNTYPEEIRTYVGKITNGTYQVSAVQNGKILSLDSLI